MGNRMYVIVVIMLSSYMYVVCGCVPVTPTKTRMPLINQPVHVITNCNGVAVRTDVLVD